MRGDGVAARGRGGTPPSRGTPPAASANSGYGLAEIPQKFLKHICHSSCLVNAMPACDVLSVSWRALTWGAPLLWRQSAAGYSGIVNAADLLKKHSGHSRKLADTFSKELVDDIYRSSFRNQTGVSLKYMMVWLAPAPKRFGLFTQQRRRDTPTQPNLGCRFELQDLYFCPFTKRRCREMGT